MSDLQWIAENCWSSGGVPRGHGVVARDHVEQVTDQLTRTVAMSADTRE